MRGYNQQNIKESILQDTQLQKDIELLKSRTKWIDINQFLEGRRYFNIHSIIRFILFCGIFISLGLGIASAVCRGFVFIPLAFLFIDSSRIIKKAYSIQDGYKHLIFRIVEDSKGKKGICKAGRLKLRLLLPFEYDEIFATYENSYVCKKDGKYGVYNTDLKKMSIPVIYDDIYSITPESIVLIKDEQKYCLTHKGYRVVK